MKKSLGGKPPALGVKRTRAPYMALYPPGSINWVAPYSGRFRFYLWGPGMGGNNSNGNGSGALTVTTLNIAAGQSVTGTVGKGYVINESASGNDSTLTFPNGRTTTAAAPLPVTPRTGGLASGGDINYNGADGGVQGGAETGSTGQGTGGGAGGTGSGYGGGGGAPGIAPFFGGKGGNRTGNQGGRTPGGGGQGGPENSPGGDGLLIITSV